MSYMELEAFPGMPTKVRCNVCGQIGARYCPECDEVVCESCHGRSQHAKSVEQARTILGEAKRRLNR